MTNGRSFMVCRKCGSEWLTTVGDRPWCNGLCGGYTTLVDRHPERIFESSRDPNVKYHVRRLANGRLTCTCLGFQFSRWSKSCRHVNEVEASAKEAAA